MNYINLMYYLHKIMYISIFSNFKISLFILINYYLLLITYYLLLITYYLLLITY